MESPFIDSVSDGWIGLGEKSKTLKRRLRRERIAMEKQGDFIPFNLQVTKRESIPVPVDQPKLTNSGKRAARKRRKLALEEAFFTELVTADRPTSFIDGEHHLLKSRKQNKHVKYNESLPLESTEGPEEVDPSNIPRKIQNKRLKSNESLPLESTEEQKEVDPPLNDSSEENELLAGEKPKPTESSNQEKKDAPPKKKRYVLFIGNLSFDTKEEDVTEHFKKIGTIASVRLAKHKGSDACRGFCHLEVRDEETYLKALSLHHSFMAKRRINVEYSSGQAEEKGELKRKNFKLHHLNKTGQLSHTKMGWKNTAKPKVKAIPTVPIKGAFFV